MKQLITFSLIVSFIVFGDKELFDQSRTNIVSQNISTIQKINNQQIIEFAKSVLGTPYVYASKDPKVGFDCSGFISYVYNHFNIEVPRSSVDFTDFGTKINPNNVVPGDLILFTGTNSSIRIVGHMGIVVKSTTDIVEFIHCTSGKAYSVTITPLNAYYQSRFMMFKRIPLK